MAVGLVLVDADDVRIFGRCIEVSVVIVVSESRIVDDRVELIAFIVGSRNHLEVGSVWMLLEDGCQLCVVNPLSPPRMMLSTTSPKKQISSSQ